MLKGKKAFVGTPFMTNNDYLANSFWQELLLLFDLLYNQLIDSLPTIAGEVKGNNRISRESVENLFDVAFEGALKEFEKSSLSFESEWAPGSFFQMAGPFH